MATPKQLRKVSDGQIFAYTEALAARADMVPVWEPGEKPEDYVDEKPAKGLVVESKDIDLKVKALLREKDKMILRLEKQLEVVGNENQRLHDEIDALKNRDSDEAPEPSDEAADEPEAPKDGLPPDQRMELLIEKTAEMIRKGDPNDFTGMGVPRVERLEAWAGIADITAKERTKAFEEAKRLI